MAAMDIFSDYLIFLLIEHQITHTSTTMNAWSAPYILTHNWKLFFLNVWCSVCVTGCLHISSHILSTKGYMHITTAMQTFGADLLFIFICTLSMDFSPKQKTGDDDDDDIKWLTYQPWRVLGPHYILTIYSNILSTKRLHPVLFHWFSTVNNWSLFCKWIILCLIFWLIGWSLLRWKPLTIILYCYLLNINILISMYSHINHDERLIRTIYSNS